MEKTLSDALDLLGCTPLEIQLFLTAFRLGPSRITDLAAASKIRRSTAYLLTQNLISQGLFLEDNKAYGKKIYPLEPAKLLQMLSRRQKSLRRQEEDFADNLGLLQSAYKSTDLRPKISSFEGRSGLLRVWQDILSATGEILIWTNQ